MCVMAIFMRFLPDHAFSFGMDAGGVWEVLVFCGAALVLIPFIGILVVSEESVWLTRVVCVLLNRLF